jgi:hypothetical protein
MNDSGRERDHSTSSSAYEGELATQAKEARWGETVPLPRESLLGLSEQGISSVPVPLSHTQTGSYSLAPAAMPLVASG